MKNPFASLKKLKKKEVIVFAVILFLLLIFFVIRKQKGGTEGGGGGEIAYVTGDSNETRNQIADMKTQNDTSVSALRDEMLAQNEAVSAGMIGLKDGINDIISYNGSMQNQVPMFENMFAQFDTKLEAVTESNNALKQTINDSTKNVSPSAPPAPAPVSNNSIFKTGSYGTAESASKALTYMSSWGGKNGSIVRNDDGSYRAVATYDDQAKSQRVGENLHSKGLLKVYYAGGASPEQKSIAVTKKSTPKPVAKTAPKTAPKPVTKPVVKPKKK